MPLWVGTLRPSRPFESRTSNLRLFYRLRLCSPRTMQERGPINWRKCNACWLGIMPFDRSLCFCERRGKRASSQIAACHRSSQSGCDSKPGHSGGGGSIAMTPFRAVCGPTTTTLLPTMIHPSLAAADLRRPDDVYAKVFASHGAKLERHRDLAAPRCQDTLRIGQRGNSVREFRAMTARTSGFSPAVQHALCGPQAPDPFRP
jgi:hypothetical protein